MRKKGEITVFLSLVLAVMLFFIQVCLESARLAFFRSRVQEALELAEYSVLSEFHRELLERYELFYLDLSYGGGAEDREYFKQRIGQFISENLEQNQIKDLEVWEMSRPTDEGGSVFYEQAVSVMRQKTGLTLLENLVEYEGLGKEAEHYSQVFEEKEIQETENLEELKRRREEEEAEGTPDPVSEVNALKRSSILHLVLEDSEKISGKKAELAFAPSVRVNISGSGAREVYPGNVGNDVFFHGYLLEYFSNAVDFLAEGQAPGPWLNYQTEYVIAGKDTDIKNLEAVCGRLLLLREGLNYAYLLTDSAKVAECEALAAALVGATMIPGLVEALKQVLLLAWAFAESVSDVRQLLSGGKVAFWKTQDTWKLSLEQMLTPEDSIGEAEGKTDEGGLAYRDYLGIFLTLTNREKKAMRGLDVIEGTIRGSASKGTLYMDQCTDGFWVRVSIAGKQELQGERWFCYEW